VVAGIGFNMIDKYNEDKLEEQKHLHDLSVSTANLEHSTSFMP